MARIRIKSILASLLATIVLLTSFTPLVAQPLVKQSEYFSIDFLSDTKGVDLAGIKVDIYESILTDYDSIFGITEYDHSFIKSAYTDSKGSVTFVKPSDRFLVIIDLVTLPFDSGVDKDLVFYNDVTQQKDTRLISAIAKVDVVSSQSSLDFVKVEVFDSRGEEIKAYYTVTPNTSAFTNARASILDNAVNVSGYVTVGSFVKSYSYTVESTTDLVTMVADALNENKITKEEALDLYMDVYNFGKIGECGTILVSKLTLLYEDILFFSHLPIEKQNALETIITPNVTRGSAKYEVPNSYFIIHFDHPTISGTTTNPPQLIYEMGEAFKVASELFVDTLGYRQPISIPLFSHYNVYVRDYSAPGGYAGWCAHVPYVSGASFIELFKITDLDIPITDAQKALVAHEFFHAIQCMYGLMVGFLPGWYSEGFAEWAEFRCFPAGMSTFTNLNTFLSSPETAFAIWKYPAVALPLYLYIYYGGDAIIQAIVESTENSINVIQSISYLTQSYSGNTFEQVFARFWADNYTPQGTYSSHSSGNSINAKPDIAHNYGNSYPTNDNLSGLSPLSSTFREFNAPPSGTSWDITLTINTTSGTASNLGVYLLMRISDTLALQKSISPSSSTLKTTILSSTTAYNKGCVMPVNFGTSGDISCSLTVSVSLKYPVTVDLDGGSSSNSGAGYYAPNSPVSINAGSKPGHLFFGWHIVSGLNSLPTWQNNPASFTMPSGAVSVKALWTQAFSVTINDSNHTVPGGGWYIPNTIVYINAGAKSGHVFTGWTVNSGGVQLANASNPSTYFTIKNNNVTVTANWAQVYSVTLNGGYSGSYGAGTHIVGTTVYIDAGTRQGYSFNGWTVNSGGVSLANSSSASTSFTMPYNNVTVTANWTQNPSSYSVSVNNSWAYPDGSGTYATNSTVYIHAGTRNGYLFDGWSVNSGGVSLANSSSASTSFTMPANAVSVTANWVVDPSTYLFYGYLPAGYHEFEVYPTVYFGTLYVVNDSGGYIDIPYTNQGGGGGGGSGSATAMIWGDGPYTICITNYYGGYVTIWEEAYKK